MNNGTEDENHFLFTCNYYKKECDELKYNGLISHLTNNYCTDFVNYVDKIWNIHNRELNN